MQVIFAWFQHNLGMVFFVYGLAFLIMGIAIWIFPKRESRLPITKVLWLLSGFGITHGANELLDMWAIIKGKSLYLDLLRWSLLLISYLFLFEFARR